MRTKFFEDDGSCVVKDWITKAGYHALILMIRGSYHTGYVGVPNDHKAAGLLADDELLDNIQVHGGITFESYGQEITLEGSPFHKELYYLGYDCAHGGDQVRVPLEVQDLFPKSSKSVFRDVDYCVEQCESLAKQLKELMK